MLNSIETYTETGRKTALARKQHDESRARFLREWFRRALALETPENRKAAQEAFNTGYREEGNFQCFS